MKARVMTDEEVRAVREEEGQVTTCSGGAPRHASTCAGRASTWMVPRPRATRAVNAPAASLAANVSHRLAPSSESAPSVASDDGARQIETWWSDEEGGAGA